MKKVTAIMLSLVLASCLIVGLAWAGVASTPHNLSSSGQFDYKTTNSSRVCEFCHTPHGSNDSVTGVALWNRKTDAIGFTMYTFARDNSLLNGRVHMTTADTPQGMSLACLSCHDGTIAFDQFFNGPTTTSRTYDYDATGASRGWSFAGGNKMEGFGSLGKNLTANHPISVTYDSSKGYRNGGYVSLPVAKTNGAKFFGDNGDQVECSSCHEPHDETNPPFLVKSNSGSALCGMCHG